MRLKSKIKFLRLKYQPRKIYVDVVREDRGGVIQRNGETINAINMCPVMLKVYDFETGEHIANYPFPEPEATNDTDN